VPRARRSDSEIHVIDADSSAHQILASVGTVPEIGCVGDPTHFKTICGGSVMFIKLLITTALALPIAFGGSAAIAQTPTKNPNILVIMGDDVGWFNIGAYHQGIMSGKTPNLDQLASQGMRFTDYYAEASCTAGVPISSPANCQSEPV
jgi:hypothetical protein